MRPALSKNEYLHLPAMNSPGIPPVIILGMHRSGTTMLARMLRDLGLFIGWSLQENYESRFFLEINQSVMNASHGTWDNPEVIEAVLANPEMRRKIVRAMRADLRSFSCLYYLGPRHFLKYRSAFRIDRPWGWKEPQNTILLPLWLDIFPSARIVHIYRNGVDVAGSLASRERKRIAGVLNEKETLTTMISSQRGQLKNASLPAYLLQKLKARYEKLQPPFKYSGLGVRPSFSLEKGFRLWTYYVEKAFSWTEGHPEQSISVKYEDFLLDPCGRLNEIARFCGLRVDSGRVRNSAETADVARGFAFKKDAALAQFHEQVRQNHWMIKLGYGG